MFSDILGIPAHPLYVHAAVVLVPLLALLAVVLAVVTAYYVVRTGDSGAESVWGRT